MTPRKKYGPKNPPLSPRPKSKPKRKQKPKDVEEVLFNRDNGKRIPFAVQEASALWLDLFMGINELTAPEKSESASAFNYSNGQQWLTTSAELADYALELYEKRWPHSGRREEDK